MATLQDVARSRGMNSLTAPRQAGASALAEAAAGQPGVSAVRTLGTLLSPSEWLRVPKTWTDAIAGRMTAGNMARIADRLFSPEGMDYLRSMGGLPYGARSIAATARFFGQQQGLAAAQPSPPQPTAPPSIAEMARLFQLRRGLEAAQPPAANTNVLNLLNPTGNPLNAFAPEL
jgi:hypothetical protein